MGTILCEVNGTTEVHKASVDFQPQGASIRSTRHRQQFWACQNLAEVSEDQEWPGKRDS